MSSADLKSFLVKLDEELMRGKETREKSVQAYRTQEGNKKASTLTYAPRPITDAILHLGGQIDEKIAKDYIDLVDKLNKSMKDAFYNLYMKNKSDVTYSEDGSIITVAIIKRGKRDNYAKLRKSYTRIINKFYKDFLVIIGKPEGVTRMSGDGKTERITSTGGKAFAQTHEDGGSNVLNQMNDAIYAAIDKVNAESVKVTPNVQKELKELQNDDADIILNIIKDGKLGTVNLGITSALINSQTGGGIKEQGTRDQLAAAIASLSEFLQNTKGSDSLVTGHRKKLIKELVKPFMNRKGIKVTHEDFKIQENKKPTKLVKKAGKTTLVKLAAAKLASKGKVRKAQKRKAKPPRMALHNILGLINARLPQQVAGNMGHPKLENRTGKFAQSVRAIDVTQTTKGFPSIGYTYAKSPYQVYESTSGSRFSDTDRDPRTLIDFSIREIVAQFGLGRLYTRRL